jgi:hypothetical protein
MTPVYQHRQMAWPVIVLAGGVMGVVAVILIVAGPPIMGGVVAALEGVVLLLFGSLTVRVDRERLRLHFGIGLIRKSIDLRQVRGFRVVRNPWFVQGRKDPVVDMSSDGLSVRAGSYRSSH